MHVRVTPQCKDTGVFKALVALTMLTACTRDEIRAAHYAGAGLALGGVITVGVTVATSYNDEAPGPELLYGTVGLIGLGLGAVILAGSWLVPEKVAAP
jgi:hypothetical protein